MIKAIHRPHYLIASLVIACLTVHTLSIAQQVSTPHTIHLKSGAVNPEANARQWLQNRSAMAVAKEPTQVLIHFNSLPTKAQRTLLQENGITLLDYIPDNTFSALVQPTCNTENILSAPIHSIINTQPEWKADDFLWKKVNGQNSAVEVLVSFYPNIDGNTIRQFISAIGGKIDAGPMEKYSSYKVIIASRMVQAIAQWYGVRYISPVTAMVPLDLQSRPIVKGNIATSSPVVGGFDLMGDSVTVGVGDDGSGIYHTDLKDRITNFNPGPETHHGEFVNGVVAGAAIVDPMAASMAPHALLLDYLYDLILPATGAMYRDYNMTIANNSYEVIAGDCSYAGTYDVYAQLLDTLSIEFPYVQHVFASGNDGSNTCSPYLPGFATVGGGYQPAKNNIVVGSMTDFFIQAPDESRGPVKDGRLKPEIIAVGLLQYSTIGANQYEFAAGTSFASPQVAGGLAELTQRYKQLNGTQPRADVLKTILLDGAMDLGNPGPDYTFGFGSMDIYRSLQIMNNGHYVTNAINDGGTQSFNITIPANTAQLKVMLYWNDVPASPSSSKQLVNDLDLTVNDPASTVHLPLILDPTPANVNNNATEQADHLNNVEQVTITNPAAGTYTVNTKGFSIPFGPQSYVVAYDIIPMDLQLTFPIGGEQLWNADSTVTDSIRIYWDAITDGNTFTIQISADNGANWKTLSNNVAANTRYFPFQPTGFNSGNCLVRVLRNNTTQVSTSQIFTINTQPVVSLDTAQCPGYVNIHWASVPAATSYYLLCKKGPFMQVVDSIAGTSYSFRNMSLTDNSYVAVQPVLNGMPGYRSLAAIMLANTGDCSNPVSSGDLMIEKIVSPTNGRMYTSTQFGPTTPMQVKVRDLYTADCNNYTLTWQVNGGLWQTITNPGVIPAHNSTIITIPGLPLTDTGTYNITVAIHNQDIADPQPANDTVSFTVLNLPNDTIDLTSPFFDGFETMGRLTVGNDSIGVSPNGHWDYFNTNDSGRMRSFVSDAITITGNRSISLDENQATTAGSKNTFVGTFNLGKYDTSNTEVRVDFDYLLHGTPKSAAGNLVTARGNDTSSWASIFTYDLSAYPGIVTHVPSLSFTDALRQSKHNFSPSSQVSFGQNDTSLIAAINYGNGITIDNFKLYTVVNDAEMAAVISPKPANCGLPASVPLTVQVHNGVSNTLYNVQLFYSMDGGATYTGAIDSIKPKSNVNYTFTQQLDIAPGSTHTLNVWLKETGDSYTGNDTILNYHIRNSQVISAYPYLENFESGDGGYYTDGFLSSWQYGTPASHKINKAASGVKAWKTNLTGNYNNLEKSYLYSPCFDISQLINPMLSFSTAMDIENCGGTLCDAGYIEYSFDGATWTKLGAAGKGINWYDSTFDVWNTEGLTRWHVATIPIPELGSGQTTHFRFVMAADPGATFEGIAVDDIHIYDLANPIAPANGISTLTQDAGSNLWTNYLLNNQLLAAVEPVQTISNTTVTLYAHDTLSNPTATQYTMPRSYTIKAPQSPTSSTNVRLYLLDSDVINVLKDTTCPSCTKLTDAYSLGVTQYDNAGNANAENGTLADDIGGVFTYYPYKSVKWVPYDKGYYAEFSAKPFSEFWFNNGGPTGQFPAAGADYLNFIAFKDGANVSAYWYSLIDTAVDSYAVQRSYDGIAFTTISDTAAKHVIPGEYVYKDPVNISADSVIYYRLRWTMAGENNYYYSPIRRIDNTDSGASLINMNAQMVSHSDVLVNWLSYVDDITNNYRLERAVGNGAYTNISDITARRLYGSPYYFTDSPQGDIPSGTPIHYRLTAILDDGNEVVLPVRTIQWISDNTVINVYPNPNYDGNFTISWAADPGTIMNVNIFDVLGRSRHQANVTATQWNNSTTLQTFTGPKGVYYVHINIGGKLYAINMVYN